MTKAFDPAELLARVGTLARARLLHDSLKKTELATRRARDAADEANRAKDVFLATVSHELRTPLNSILGWARLLSEGTLDRETLARGLATIQRNAQIQVQLIEDILDTTRAISGKLHLELTTFELGQVARAAFDAAKPSADAKQIELQLIVPEAPLRVRGDIDRLQQAVGNLLTNAVKFTPAGGQVRIELSRPSSRSRCRCMTPARASPNNFCLTSSIAFGKKTTQPRAAIRGSGSGWPWCVISWPRMAGPSVHRVRAKGAARRSRLRCPVTTSELRATARAIARVRRRLRVDHGLPVGRLSNIKILVVEDDEDARDLLVTVLTQQGAKVSQAGNASEALSLVTQSLPDVMLSDIGLPGEDGYELMRAVRARGIMPDILPAIALTAYSRREDQRLALQAGFQAHVAKPVEPAILVAAVADAALLASRK